MLLPPTGPRSGSELVTKEYLDARLLQLESKLEIRLAQMQNKILASQVALFFLLGIAIYFK
jgi:hypothetical protein